MLGYKENHEKKQLNIHARTLKAFFFAAVLCLLPFGAQAIELKGALMQGGYVYGKAPAGSEVYLEGKRLKTDANGNFFAGLNRHFTTVGELKIKPPKGEAETHTFMVTPQDYPVQHIKGVSNKHVNPDPKQVERSRKEAAAIRKSRSFFTEEPAAFKRFVLPIKGYPVSGVYGSSRTYNGEERSWHKGLDLAAPSGTPIYAPADGIVRAALADTFFNGNIIVVDHGYGLFSIYAHLRHMAVTEGTKIRQGDVLGEVGTTGRSTGPHLHWGLYWHNIALDPKLFLTDNERNEL